MLMKTVLKVERMANAVPSDLGSLRFNRTDILPTITERHNGHLTNSMSVITTRARLFLIGTSKNKLFL
jgi:hypothetical protein